MKRIDRQTAPLDATGLVDRYLELHAATDLEGVLALFAENASVEEPVGTPVLRGQAAIRAFYCETHRRNGRLLVERIGPVLRRGNELAAHVRARLARSADAPATDVIYTMELDEEGRIRRFRAYF